MASFNAMMMMVRDSGLLFWGHHVEIMSYFYGTVGARFIVQVKYCRLCRERHIYYAHARPRWQLIIISV